MMTVIYHDRDGDLSILQGKRTAIIGYGNMGRPAALNLRDSGVNVMVSEPRAERAAQAVEEGFTPRPVEEAVAEADIIMPLLRDEAMPAVYLETIAPHLRRGQMLIFSSAYNLTYSLIEAPGFVDVGLVSARTFGAAVRERYLSGEGYTSFVAVAQDASSQAWERLLAIARGMGALRGGAVEVPFEHETHLDLFLQQSVLPLFHRVVITAAQILIEAGYSPEAVFTELYLSGETADYLRSAAQNGLMRTLEQQSLPAQYGILSRYERLNTLGLERLMDAALRDIREKKFSGEWAKEFNAEYPRLRQLMRQRQQMDLWELEQQTLESLHPEE
jgi:ketol-acid reductoisomerase